MVEEKLNLERPTLCEQCGWYGRLRECKQKEIYTVSNTIHHFMCPECNSDVYTFTEDKHPEDDTADDEERKSEGLLPLSPDSVRVSTNVVEEAAQ